MAVKRGIIVWISAFASFLAILGTFGVAVMLVNQGADTIVNPYVLGSIFGDLSAATYLHSSRNHSHNGIPQTAA